MLCVHPVGVPLVSQAGFSCPTVMWMGTREEVSGRLAVTSRAVYHAATVDISYWMPWNEVEFFRVRNQEAFLMQTVSAFEQYSPLHAGDGLPPQ